MQLLQKRNTLQRQSGQLLGYLDALFRRLVLPRPGADEPNIECSREEIRALILLGASGRTIMSDFAGQLGVPLSTATHAVDRLVAKGLVIRVRSEQDRRVVQVQMSESGMAFQTALRSRHQALTRSWLTPLSPSERESFLHLMAKITEGASLDSGLEPELRKGASTARRVSPGGQSSKSAT
jgi:MarR family transcriptional regulator, organic hydroperoxide resistance regulator